MAAKQKQTAKWCGVLALSAVALVGCSNKQAGHDQWVDAATGRYNALRSGMMLDMAQQQFDGGDLKMAQNSVTEVLAQDPENARAYVLSGRIALERGQLERSYHMLQKAAELDPQLPAARFYQGVVLQRWQQYDKAQAAYSEAYELQADNVSYLLASAEMMVAAGRSDEAVALLESKTQYFDQNAGLRAAIGHLYRMKGRHADAAFYFEQASLLSPDNVKLMEEVALARLAAKDYERAIPALYGLLQRPGMDKRDDLRRSLALAYIQTGRTDKAREIYLGLARGSNPSAADWIKLGELSLQSDDLFGALQAANHAIGIEPQKPEGYLLAGMAMQKRGGLDEALRMFDRAAALAPRDASPMILRGISLEKAGKRTAAAEAYSEALRRQPGDPRAERLLANLQPSS